MYRLELQNLQVVVDDPLGRVNNDDLVPLGFRLESAATPPANSKSQRSYRCSTCQTAVFEAWVKRSISSHGRARQYSTKGS